MSLLSTMKSYVLRGPVSLHALQEARIEIHLATVRIRSRWSRKAKQLRLLRGIKLNFGCGEHILGGWLNVDGWDRPGVDFVHDLRQSLPLADDCCKFIFTEHVLEHIELQFRTQVLRELYRLLEPGGVLRIVGPSCAPFARAYASHDMTFFARAVPEANSAAAALNEIFINHFHRFVDDFESFAGSLKEAGFENVVESHHRGSSISELNVDSDEPSRMIGNLYIEARKAGASSQDS